MDFASLPDVAFLKLFEYLHLDDCIRVGRVNKTFHRIAQLSIPKTKSLDFSKDCFRYLTPDQMADILDSYSPNLEWIKFPTRRTTLDNHGQQMATVFANYQCPRLIEIDLGQTPINIAVFANYQCPQLIEIDLGQTPINIAVFEQLIRNNPGIKNLVWYGDFVGFPAVTNTNLKKLGLRLFNNATLKSLIGRCPNLKELELIVGSQRDVTADMLDQFFGSIPKVHQVKLGIYHSWTMFNIAYYPGFFSFWKLPLTSLNLDFGDSCFPGWGFVRKLAMAFPNLKKIHLDEVDPENADISIFATLQELESLCLHFRGEAFRFGAQYDQGIRQLSDCKKLQKLGLPEFNVSGVTLVHLLQSCPQLGHVVIWDITNVTNPQKAAAILKCLAGIDEGDVIIQFRTSDVATVRHIWTSIRVKEVIRKLEKRDGLKIKVMFRE